MTGKLTRLRLEQNRRALFNNRDKDAALALFHHSVALQQGWRACERFLVANTLGASFTDADRAYQAAAWAKLSPRMRDKVQADALAFLEGKSRTAVP